MCVTRSEIRLIFFMVTIFKDIFFFLFTKCSKYKEVTPELCKEEIPKSAFDVFKFSRLSADGVDLAAV